MIFIKNEQELKYMQIAGEILAELYENLKSMIKEGVRGIDLDRYAEDFILSKGGKPAFKGYPGENSPYPATLCISVNRAVVHGIPNERKFKKGDIVSIDGGVIYKGYYSDAAFTVGIGKVSKLKRKLMEVTRNALYIGLQQIKPGRRFGDISHAIQEYVESNGFSVVRVLGGHGVGRHLHEEPFIPNFGNPGTGQIIKKNMTFAIEPMVNAGKADVRVLSDGWTIVTADNKPSAHFEHTVVVTDDGYRILTKNKEVY